MSMMKSEEASSMDGDMHATRRERNSKSGTSGNWGRHRKPDRSRQGRQLRFSRILDNPDVPVLFRAVSLKRVQLPPGFLICSPP
jgi:hypothetical protein